MGVGDPAQGIPASQQGYPQGYPQSPASGQTGEKGSAPPYQQQNTTQQGPYNNSQGNWQPQNNYQQGYSDPQYNYQQQPYNNQPAPAGYPGQYGGGYGGYPQQPYQGYPNQPQYVQQPNNSMASNGCLEGCLAALCCCFALELCLIF